jgi:hypothetical protein
MTVTLSIPHQLQRLQAYAASGVIADPQKVGVTYYSQRDNYCEPWRTCNASSNAMYLDWLLRVTGRKPLGGDDGYLRQVFKIGDSPQHWVQTQAIKAYGFTTVWREDGNFDNIDALLAAGFPVVLNIAHKGSLSAAYGGHIIIAIGIEADGRYIAHDPWGDLLTGYRDKSGAYLRYPRKEIHRRHQGGYRAL